MPFKSKAQQRFMFAAESRGEVPKGTARRWAHETKGIKSLPERKMKKEAMFFEGREQPEDGMFMKCAQMKMPETPKKPQKIPVAPPKKEGQSTSTEEAKKGSRLPLGLPSPMPKLGGMIGHPGIGRPGIKTAQMGMGLATQAGIPPSGGGMDVGAPTPMMGAGAKAKKRGQEKKAADLKESIISAGKSTGEGALRFATKDVPEYAEKGLKGIENLPDWAKAALVGGTGLYAYGKGKKAVKSLARKAAPAASEGTIAKMLGKIRKLRGR